MLADDAINVEAGVEIPCPGSVAAAATSYTPSVSTRGLVQTTLLVVGVRTLACEAAFGGVGLVDVENGVVVALQ
jgi:hypothetical protein